jgi:fatty acid desaturase
VTATADVRSFVAERGLHARSATASNRRTAAVLALYAGLAAIGFAADHWLVWVAVWFVQSLVLVGSYSAMHEAGHGTLYRSRLANRVAGVLWASTILVNWSLWRSFHLEHHAHTAEADDPEARYKVDIRRRSQYLLMPLGGLQFLGDLWFGSLGTLGGRYPRYVRTRDGRRAIRLEAVLLLGVTALVVWGAIAAPAVVVRLWLAPLLVMACLTMPGTALNEHYGCASDGGALQTSRTVLSNRFMRFVLWNGNFHAGHHLVPSVPFHRAPELFDYLEPRAGFVASGYLAFHREVLRGCR